MGYMEFEIEVPGRGQREGAAGWRGPVRLWVGALLGALLAATAAAATGVVTDGERMWARRALEEERAVAHAAAANTVGVLYFRNQTGDADLDPLQKGLTLMLITDLAQVPRLQVVERVRLQALVEEMGLGHSGLVEAGTEPRLGRLLGARWLIGGTLKAPAPNSLRVESRVLDVPANGKAADLAAEGELSEFFSIEKALLFSILGHLDVELTPPEESRLRKPCSRSTSALLALSRGVTASDEGDYEAAAAHYERALLEDPGVCLAGDRLRELQARGYARPRIRRRDMMESLRSESSLTNRITTESPLRRPGNVTEPRRVPVDVQIDFP